MNPTNTENSSLDFHSGLSGLSLSASRLGLRRRRGGASVHGLSYAAAAGIGGGGAGGLGSSRGSGSSAILRQNAGDSCTTNMDPPINGQFGSTVNLSVSSSSREPTDPPPRGGVPFPTKRVRAMCNDLGDEPLMRSAGEACLSSPPISEIHTGQPRNQKHPLSDWRFSLVEPASLPPAFQKPPSPPLTFDSPVFAWEEIATLLDTRSLGRLASTCKELCSLVGRSHAWKTMAYEPWLAPFEGSDITALLPGSGCFPRNARHALQMQAKHRRAWLDGSALARDYLRTHCAVDTVQRLLLHHYPLHATLLSLILAGLRKSGVFPDLPWLAIIAALVALPLVVGASVLLQRWSREKQHALVDQSHRISLTLPFGTLHTTWMRVAQRIQRFPVGARRAIGFAAEDTWHIDGYTREVLARCLSGYKPHTVILVACTVLWVVSFALLPHACASFDISAPRRLVRALIDWIASFHSATVEIRPCDDDGLPSSLIARLVSQITRFVSPPFHLPWSPPIAITQMAAAALSVGVFEHYFRRVRLTPIQACMDIVVTALLPYGVHVVWSLLEWFVSSELGGPATLFFGVDALGAWVSDVILAAALTPSLWPHVALWTIALPVAGASTFAGSAARDKRRTAWVIALLGVAFVSAVATASQPSQSFAIGSRATLILVAPIVGKLFAGLRCVAEWLASELGCASAPVYRYIAIACLAVEAVSITWANVAFVFPVGTLLQPRWWHTANASVLLAVVFPIWVLSALSTCRRVYRAAALLLGSTVTPASSSGCIVVFGGFRWLPEQDDPIQY